jgi:hypothetical protein
MIHVGGSGGVLLLVPISSSIIARQCVQLDADADTRPSTNLDTIKLPVLQYHDASPRHFSGKYAGHVLSFCFTTSAVSPSTAKDAI